MRKLLLSISAVLFYLILPAQYTYDTIQVMTYNLLNYSNNVSNSARSPYFKTVIDSMQPDILVVQEIISQAAVDSFLSQVLDTTYSTGQFIDGPDTGI